MNCSAKWWFRYGLGLPDPAGGGAARGRAVHKAIEYYMRARMNGLVLDGEALAAGWDEIWDEVTETAEFAAGDDIDALKASGAQLAAKYLREAAPAVNPIAVEIPVSGEISGVRVRGIIDIIDDSGRVIDVKTSSRKPSKVAGDHAFQLATYVSLLGNASSGETRIDALVATKDPQLVQIDHQPGERGRTLVERMYPLVAEGIASGLFIPNRASTLCSYCAYKAECVKEYGGAVE